MSRKDKKDIKRRTADANRLDNFDDIGDVGDFEEIAKLVGRSSSGAAGGSARGSLAGMDEDDDEDYGRKGKAGANALQRAVAAMSGRKGGMDSDDEEDEVEQMLGGAHKRRRAPEGRMDEEEDTLLEDFGSKKKAFLAKKSEHYTAEPRYGGATESVEDGQKRAATYEIMKNKGLTPHRKKENRNPRVKKRAAYAKAVISRKGQVREVITGAAGGYSGEMTGIKAQVSRSRKIGV
jgi:U3 small nucleolar RNA-associated protein 3